ncbi:sigma 54-interacting transcriptional regulator [Pontibacter sp. JAM-7]|uniref:sigma-54 dependent transcriptional regulator n=1 Tax=Pontibacter sp. JAM-7 TaxID=3366581 RepID=UPI003AF606CD
MNTEFSLANPSDTTVRKALYLDLAEYHQNDIDTFEFSNWAIDRVTNLHQAKSHMEHYPYLVGMVYLSNLTPEQHEQIITIINSDYTRSWIALIEHRDLLDSQFRRLIYENFYDYFTLPLKDNFRFLKTVLGHAYGIAYLRAIEHDAAEEYTEYSEMVGASNKIRQVFDGIRKVAGVDAPVLISGDTGTGKEMVARAIHQRSDRAEGPFIAVNCGALPDTLIHAELFGFEKGAFTGAYKQKIGKIEAAQGGTIFLDEIGDLPLELQVYLLRFLEESTIERLGGNDSHHVNARIIAASHVNLEEAVDQGHFREDLFYRLNVLNIHVPSLAERFEDIELLAYYFFRKFSDEYGLNAQGFTRKALMAMNSHPWPGNIREMINRIRRALVMTENRLITPADLGLDLGYTPVDVVSLDEARQKAEEVAIKSTLHYAHNNISKTAKMLGISRVTLYRLIDKYGLK